ncbi:GAP1-N2 domain-containing protein [Corynebacterium suranareeae]|nr:hypothetical protein [Corynebacterium suranareeae]
MRWTHVTYASFKGTAGRGGWKVGTWSAQATKEDRQFIAEVAPTHIETVTPFDDFISSEDIDALPRRFEYRPLPGRSLIMQSVPAGKDATGRPGNVFTHAVIDGDLESPLESVYPISLYRSPDLLTPFRAAAVNASELPIDSGEPRIGPMTDLSLAWMMVDSMFGDRRQVFYQLQDVLQAGEKTAVLILNSTNEAAYWIQALSSTLTPNEARRLLHFSTFERAATLPIPDKSMDARSLFVVPGIDRELLAEHPRIVIIDPENPQHAKAAPQGSWSRMTQGLYADGFDADEIVAGLISANENLDNSQKELAQFGDGLARFIRSGRFSSTHPIRVLADQHMFGKRPDKLATQAVSTKPAPNPNEIWARASEVIHNPRRASESHDWPSLRRLPDSRRRISNMSEQAISSIEKLHDSPAQDLVSYLDFLLKTELATSINAADPYFRSSFSDFPALANWRRVRLSADAHPRLRELLVDAERDARNRAPVGIVLDHVILHVSRDKSLPEIEAWLETPQAQQIIAGINNGVSVQTGRNHFMWDLLRVYFAIAVFGKDETYRAFSTLTVDSVSRFVQSTRKEGKTEDIRRFERFGEQIALDDLPLVLSSARAIQHYRSYIERDVINKKVSRDRDVNKIFAVVAQAIIKTISRNNSGEDMRS